VIQPGHYVRTPEGWLGKVEQVRKKAPRGHWEITDELEGRRRRPRYAVVRLTAAETRTYNVEVLQRVELEESVG